MNRRARRAVAAVLAALVLLVPLACSSSDETGGDAKATGAASAVAGAASGDASGPAGTLAPGQVAHDVGTSFQYKSFIITVGTIVYDPGTSQLTLGLRFANRSGGWGQTETAADLELGDGTTVPLFGDLFDVPPGATVDVTASASSVPEDPVADGVITWGSASYDQPVFRLDGSGGENLWLPADLVADGWAQIGKFAVHLNGLQVNASQVDMGIHAEPGRRILRVFADEYTARGTTNPFDARSNLLLQLPSGEVVDAVDGSATANQLSWTSQGGQWADFVVPADLDGDYQLLLASIPKIGFSSLRPELIERRPIPFTLADVRPGEVTPTTPLAFPGPYPPDPEGAGEAFAVDLDAGSMNVPGYDVEPTRLTYDPATRTATLDATVTSLVSAAGPDDGLLSVAPTFGSRVVLASGGRLATGVVDGDGLLDAERPTELTFEFNDVRTLSPDDAGLYMGPGNGAVSSMPLGAASAVAAWPPAPVAHVVEVPAITAGDWTVQLHSYRLGLFNPSLPPEVGRRQLEVALTATASPTAEVKALGLSFTPVYQVLLGSGTGYDQGALADSGLVMLTPGQSVDLTVTFDVPDTFQGGRTPFVIRSRAEFGELIDFWVESRFEADLTAVAAGEDGGF